MNASRLFRRLAITIVLLAAPAAANVAIPPPLLVFQPSALSAFEPEPDGYLQDIGLLQGMSAGAFSADGQFLYVAVWYDNVIATFQRQASTGKLTLIQVLDYYIEFIDGLFGAQGVALSPDGQFVYVTSGDGGGLLAVFSRDGTTGALTFVQEVGNAANVNDLRASAFSPDGTTLYAMEDDLEEVAAWTQNALTGELTFLDFYPNPDTGAVSGIGDGLQSIVVSPDGNHVYAGRAIYARDPGTGVLTPLTGRGGVEGFGVTISADGNFLYATGTSAGAGAIEVFSRVALTGALTSIQVVRDGTGGVDGLAGADNAVLSSDGKYAYVNGKADHAIAVLARNASTGLLTFVEMQREGVGGVYGLHDTAALTMSPDGAQLYVSGFIEPSSIAVFARDPVTGKLHETAVNRGTYSGCLPAPDSGCRLPTLPGKAKLTVQDLANDAKDVAIWKWTKGEATDFFDFGDPLSDYFGEYSDHAVCLYDDTGLLLSAAAPAGASCRTRPCWREIDSKLGDQLGYDYSDALRSNHGMNKVSLRAGEDGAARASAKLGGINLPTPPPPYSGTVIVQLRNESTCWEADFSSPAVNQPGLYRATSD